MYIWYIKHIYNEFFHLGAVVAIYSGVYHFYCCRAVVFPAAFHELLTAPANEQWRFILFQFHDVAASFVASGTDTLRQSFNWTCTTNPLSVAFNPQDAYRNARLTAVTSPRDSCRGLQDSARCRSSGRASSWKRFGIGLAPGSSVFDWTSSVLHTCCATLLLSCLGTCCPSRG